MADYTKGFSVVPDSGTCPYPVGTETANEGKGSATKWAKRKGSTANEGDYGGSGKE